MPDNRNTSNSYQGHMRPAGLEPDDARLAAETMQEQLTALLDLSLTLKHVHWNVVGPGFLGVHEMLDEHVDKVRRMADALAERVATLGYMPNGLVGYVSNHRDHPDYALGRATVEAHLGALDHLYSQVIGSHREAAVTTEDPDPVTNDILIGQTGELEQLQWLLRAHIENVSGRVPSAEEPNQLEAAKVAASSDPLA
jgi:starvation-inducible DNA-binding protein